MVRVLSSELCGLIRSMNSGFGANVFVGLSDSTCAFKHICVFLAGVLSFQTHVVS